jgi:hypothetical protein
MGFNRKASWSIALAVDCWPFLLSDGLRRNSRSYPKVVTQQIALARDELAGQGLYERTEISAERYRELEQHVRIWEALLDKLTGSFKHEM